jgi:hypothetical protein
MPKMPPRLYVMTLFFKEQPRPARLCMPFKKISLHSALIECLKTRPPGLFDTAGKCLQRREIQFWILAFSLYPATYRLLEIATFCPDYDILRPCFIVQGCCNLDNNIRHNDFHRSSVTLAKEQHVPSRISGLATPIQ